MTTNPENKASAEREPTTDERLAVAISRADATIEKLVEKDIGSEAHGRGQQDAQLEAAKETLTEVGAVYYDSLSLAFGLFQALFNQKLNNGFQLESLDGRMALSKALDTDREVRVAFEVNEGTIKKRVLGLLSRPTTCGSPANYGRVEIEVNQSNATGVIDIAELEEEALAALEQATDELSTFLK